MVAKHANPQALRDVVHLGGALPAEVMLEVVYLPTFHEALGIRWTTGHLEWWRAIAWRAFPRWSEGRC